MKVFVLTVLLIVLTVFFIFHVHRNKKRKDKPNKLLLVNKEGIHFIDDNKKVFSINGAEPIYVNGVQVELGKVGTTSEEAGIVISKTLKEIDDSKENPEVRKSYAIARRTKSKRIRNKHINKIIKLENK